MTTVVRALAIAMLLAACARSAQVCDPETNKCRDANGWDGLAPFDRFEHLEEVTPIDGIQVEGAPEGTVGFRLIVRNNTDEQVTLAVEDSTFKLSDTRSSSRLIRGETKRIDSFRPQPPAQIAAHATWTGVVRISMLLSAEDLELRATDLEQKIQADASASYQRRKGAELEDIVEKERAEVTRAIVGGTLALAFQRASGTTTWTASVKGQPR